MAIKAPRFSSHTRSAFKKMFMDTPLQRLKPSAAMVVPNSASLSEAVYTLASRKIGCVVITNESKAPVGFLSERDVLVTAVKHPDSWGGVPVKEVMTPKIVSVRALGSIGRAIFEMATASIRHVVVDETASSPLGIISTRDILSYVYTELTKPMVTQSAASPGSLTKMARDDLDAFLKGPLQDLSPAAPITGDPTMSVYEAASRMSSTGIGSLLLASSSKALKGIFTDRDFLLKVAATKLPMKSSSIESVMTSAPKTALDVSSVAMALTLMFEGGFRHIPIVTSQESLTGILSLRDFLSFLSQAMMEDLDASDSGSGNSGSSGRA